MILFPEIDKRKTKRKVQTLLNNYRRLVRIASRKKRHVDDEYLACSSENRRIQALDELEKIDQALELLDSDKKQIIIEKYMNVSHATNISIYMDFHMSESKFYRELDKALLYFAEAYENGELLVEK